MVAILKSRSSHSDRLERWLGKETCEQLSHAVGGGGPLNLPKWYGPPIAVANCPGRIQIGRDGDFIGYMPGGRASALLDQTVERARRYGRAYLRRCAQRQAGKLNAGFASLSDLIAEFTAGKSQQIFWNKVGTTGVVAATNTLWFVGNQPVAGSSAGAAPGGTAWTDASTGAIPYTNPTGGDTMHLVAGFAQGTVAANTLLLYDRLFSVTKTMNSTATEAVTGTQSRYASTTGGAADSAEGNFLIIECRTALPATAHNWTVCQYTDQGGTTGVSLPSVTGNSSNIINRLDQPTGRWFCPLASGDTGIRYLTQMQCSAAVATGAIDFTIGHPLAFMPMPVANLFTPWDGVNSMMNMVRVMDDCCFALLELIKPATTATTYSGMMTMCAG